MLEIGFAGRTGGQDRDTLIHMLAVRLQRIAKRAEEGGEAMDMRLRIDIGKGAGGGHTVFEREARAGGSLGAIGQNPPVAVRATADLE